MVHVPSLTSLDALNLLYHKCFPVLESHQCWLLSSSIYWWRYFICLCVNIDVTWVNNVNNSGLLKVFKKVFLAMDNYSHSATIMFLQAYVYQAINVEPSTQLLRGNLIICIPRLFSQSKHSFILTVNISAFNKSALGIQPYICMLIRHLHEDLSPSCELTSFIARNRVQTTSIRVVKKTSNQSPCNPYPHLKKSYVKVKPSLTLPPIPITIPFT